METNTKRRRMIEAYKYTGFNIKKLAEAPEWIRKAIEDKHIVYRSELNGLYLATNTTDDRTEKDWEFIPEGCYIIREEIESTKTLRVVGSDYFDKTAQAYKDIKNKNK